MARSKMALAVIWVSVGVGVMLGLWQRVAARTTGPIRTFAVVAAGLVVALSLLPHAIASEGLAGLCVALASVAFIPALERVVRVPFRKVNAEGLRLELGFAGLLVHRFGDGVVMAVEGHGHELSWAVGAHEIPIVALVTLAYARRGLGPALVRATLLGLTSSIGLWAVRAMPGAWHDLHGWVDAIAAGILVHILAYEALPETLETPRERASDGLGALLGLSIVLWPSFEEQPEVPNVARSVLVAALHAAPFLLLGLAASAALLSYRGRSGLGRPPEGVGAGRPWPALEAFTLAAGYLGWVLAGGYWLAASLLSRLGTSEVRRLSPPTALDTQPAASASRGFWPTLEGLVLRVGGWIGVGLLAATYVESFSPPGQPLLGLGLGARALFVVALAIPASVCSAGAVPIASALVAKGLSPLLAVAGLTLGAVLSDALGSLSRAGVGSRRGLRELAPLAFAGLGVALGLDAIFPTTGAFEAPGAAVGAIEWAAFAGLVALGARSVWRVGIRGWLGSSLQALGPLTRRQAAHAHAH
ncbi:MAG TPA: hypothetical protein VMG12_07880 [Polyangiaceae bacterium]|nr:hypothetical protein [Polyangiaceae bacterium]